MCIRDRSSTGDEGIRAAVRAHDEAAAARIKSTITVDNAHAARHLRRFSPEDALLMTASILMNRHVFQVHVSDVQRATDYMNDQNHLPFGAGEVDLERTIGIISKQWPNANITVEVTGRWDFALPWRSIRPLNQSIAALKPLLQQ